MSRRHVRWADEVTSESKGAPVNSYTNNAIPLTITDDSDSCSSPALSTPSSIATYSLANDYTFVDTPVPHHAALSKPQANSKLPRAYGRDSPELFDAASSSPSPSRYPAVGLPGSPALPIRSQPSLALHPILLHSRHSKREELIWDVRFQPTKASVHLQQGRTIHEFPPELLLAPATNPPVREMRIHCLPHGIYEPLIVQATPSGSPFTQGLPLDHITIYHILRHIVHYLQKLVSKQEYSRIKAVTPSKFSDAVSQAYHGRTDINATRSPAQHGAPSGTNHSHAQPQSHQDQKHSSSPRARSGAVIGANTSEPVEGLRRLDYLLGLTRFNGLQQVDGKPGEWFLHVTTSR